MTEFMKILMLSHKFLTSKIYRIFLKNGNTNSRKEVIAVRNFILSISKLFDKKWVLISTLVRMISITISSN